VHVLAVLVFLLAVPGTTNLVLHGSAVTFCVEPCERDCDEPGGLCSGSPSTHCRCCTHANAMSTTPLVLPRAPLPHALRFARSTELSDSPGYRAPPFRPPSHT